ncbi:protein FAN-like isoform X2 [Dysidea avara]|uniref:protein FAN-like isoform X2 n=1 Tax=Dysidea avara TaxID=196820 RepID=UPI0033335B8D
MAVHSFVNYTHGNFGYSGYSGSQERFSLLLLEFGEVYFEDFTVVFYPLVTPEGIEEKKQRGRLKVCSHSVLFEPLDISEPVLKICYKHCDAIKEWSDPSLLKSDNCFQLLVSQFAEIFEGGFIAPFNFVKKKKRFLFSLTYGEVEVALSKILQLYRASTLDGAERSQLMQHIVQAQHASVSFNTSWLEDLHEKILVEITGERIAPLVCNPGRIMLTSSRLYFQPYNNVEPEPVIKIRLSDMTQLSKRRYLLKHVGVEIFTKSGSHIFLAFHSELARDSLIELILIQPDIKLEDVPLSEMTERWQRGDVSNYDYLLYLNNQGSRTFSDLTQYPVFPWVISDYTSDILDLTNPKTFRDLTKPIGALTEKRLAYFKERYATMTDNPFLYGSHYSAPGYVLFYLVRLVPEYLLCLQSGRFDHANRLFHSVAQTWQNVLNDNVDLKESIPEFYQPPGDFLLNKKGIDFGIRSDGEKIDDVILPPWASNPEDFTSKCQEALECDYVSSHLHHWIDLIFGYKQRGREAVKADNVFYYLAYEGTVDLDKITDPERYAALEQQIREFGQIPDQLFTTPHPPKHVKSELNPTTACEGQLIHDVIEQCQIEQSNSPSDPTAAAPATSSSPSSSWYKFVDVVQHHCYKLHKEAVTSIKFSPNGKTVFSTSQDHSLKIYSIVDKVQKRSANISKVPLSSLDINTDGSVAVVGSWDNNVYAYSVDYGTIVNTNYAHDNSVTCICWKKNILVTGSLDCTVKIWEISSTVQGGSMAMPILKVEFDYENEIHCLDIDTECRTVAVGTSQGNIAAWSIEDAVRVCEFEDHVPHTVHQVSFNKDGTMLLSCASDFTIKLMDITKEIIIISYSLTSIVRCFAWDDSVVVGGTDAGNVVIVQLYPSLKIINMFGGSSGTITSIDVSQDAATIAFGTEHRIIEIWTSNTK